MNKFYSKKACRNFCFWIVTSPLNVLEILALKENFIFLSKLMHVQSEFFIF